MVDIKCLEPLVSLFIRISFRGKMSLVVNEKFEKCISRNKSTELL